MSRLDDAFKPDFKALTSMVVGRPGSGKSYWLKHSLRDFMKSHKDPNYRMVYICPKHEMSLYDKSPPIGAENLEKHLRKNRTAVVYPDPDYVEAEVDYCIDTLFAIRNANPDFTCTIVVDDAQTFIQSRRAASQSFRRLALTGRSKGIRFVAVSHQMVFSKDLEGSTSYIVFFSMPVKLYHRDAMVRYGFDPEGYLEKMGEKPYSFVWFSVTDQQSTLMNPIEVKEGSPVEPKVAPTE